MNKKRFIYTGTISMELPNEIYLNVKNLKEGDYTIKLMDNKKIIKRINFKK